MRNSISLLQGMQRQHTSLLGLAEQAFFAGDKIKEWEYAACLDDCKKEIVKLEEKLKKQVDPLAEKLRKFVNEERIS